MFSKRAVLAVLTVVIVSCSESPSAPSTQRDLGLKISGQVIGPAGVEFDGMTAGLMVNAPFSQQGFDDSAAVNADGTFELEYSSCLYSFIVQVDGNGFRGFSAWLSCTPTEVQTVEVVVKVFE